MENAQVNLVWHAIEVTLFISENSKKKLLGIMPRSVDSPYTYTFPRLISIFLELFHELLSSLIRIYCTNSANWIIYIMKPFEELFH